MRILLLIQWCHPEPDFKCLPLARALRDCGHEVEILTGFPNYPGGRVYPGYRIRPWRRETLDGIRVLRVALYPSHDRSVIRRAANYASFALSATVLGPLLARRPDVVYAYNPMGLPALAFRWLRDVPFVYEIQDLWPDSLFASGMMRARLTRPPLEWFFRLVYAQAAHVIVPSRGFERVLAERGVPRKKITVIHNWTNEETHRPLPPDPTLAARLGFVGHFNVVYTGNVGQAQGLEVVLEAARRLGATHPDVLFSIVGGGTERAALQAAAASLMNVQFLPAVPPAEVAAIVAHAGALLVHLRDEPLFRITVPSKIQAYLAMGRPILAGVEGDARELVERSGAGQTFNPGDGAALAAAVVKLRNLADPERVARGECGRAFYQEQLSLPTAARQYAEIFASAGRQ